MHGALAIFHRDERFGRRPDHIEGADVAHLPATILGRLPGHPNEIHVRARIRGTKYSVDVKGASRYRSRVALRKNDLKSIAFTNVFLGSVDGLPILLVRGVRSSSSRACCWH